jgi:SH3-like domain-containing protein
MQLIANGKMTKVKRDSWAEAIALLKNAVVHILRACENVYCTFNLA